MAKGKKKKKKTRKNTGAESVAAATPGTAAKAARNLKALTQNPLIADIVAAALVGAAAALKDSKKAQRLASEAGDELGKMSKQGVERGQAMWDMALDIGRRSLEALSSDDSPKRTKTRAASTKSPAKRQPVRKNSN